MDAIKKGQIIRFKPEWSDPGDEKKLFIAIEDESKGRVGVMTMLGLPLNPWQVVSVNMIASATDPK